MPPNLVIVMDKNRNILNKIPNNTIKYNNLEFMHQKNTIIPETNYERINRK